MIEVTSPEAAQGKSTVVANLAVAFSPNRHPDDRAGRRPPAPAPARDIRPRQHVRPLHHARARAQAGAQTRRPRPWVITSGPVPPDPTEMLHNRLPSVHQGAAAAQGADPRRHPARAAGQRRAPGGAARRRRDRRRHRGHAEAQRASRPRSTGSRWSTAGSWASCSTRPGADDLDARHVLPVRGGGRQPPRITSRPTRVETVRGGRPRARTTGSRRAGPRGAAAQSAERRQRQGWSGQGARAAARQPRGVPGGKRRSPWCSAYVGGDVPAVGTRRDWAPCLLLLPSPLKVEALLLVLAAVAAMGGICSGSRPSRCPWSSCSACCCSPRGSVRSLVPLGAVPRQPGARLGRRPRADRRDLAAVFAPDPTESVARRRCATRCSSSSSSSSSS